ncbi:MAG TPA: RNA polymerase sigma factor [Candidatus Limnocylindrales bacterium]
MILTRVAPTLERREGDLGTAAAGEAGERFLRLANGELDRAYRLAGLLLGDEHEAQDATQDALIRAWQSIGSLRDPAGFQSWFDRILVNLCRDRLRRRRRITFVPIETEDDGGGHRPATPKATDPFRVVLDRDEAVRAMAGLNPDERIVLILHYWADLTLDAVADRLGWPAGTVKTRLHHGLDQIRRTLASHPDGGIR